MTLNDRKAPLYASFSGARCV